MPTRRKWSSIRRFAKPNEAVDADQLEGEHGYIKTFIYELNEMGPDAPNWLEKVREFRALVSRHAHMEEEQVFPRFKQSTERGAERARSPASSTATASGWPEP